MCVCMCVCVYVAGCTCGVCRAYVCNVLCVVCGVVCGTWCLVCGVMCVVCCCGEDSLYAGAGELWADVCILCLCVALEYCVSECWREHPNTHTHRELVPGSCYVRSFRTILGAGRGTASSSGASRAIAQVCHDHDRPPAVSPRLVRHAERALTGYFLRPPLFSQALHDGVTAILCAGVAAL